MIQLTPELLLRETEFINQVKEDLLPGIVAVNESLDRVMASIKSMDNSEAVDKIIEEAHKTLADHREIFDKSKEAAIRIKDLRLVLTEHFQASDDNLRSIIELITKEETNLVMTGEDLPGNKVALRDSMKENLGFSSAEMLNVTDLLAFADTETFSKKDKMLREKIALAIKNTEGIAASVPDKEIRDRWTRIKKEQDIIHKTIDEMYSAWGHRRELMEQLNQNVALLQARIKDIEIQAGAELARIQNRGEWTGRISVAVILVLVCFLRPGAHQKNHQADQSHDRRPGQDGRRRFYRELYLHFPGRTRPDGRLPWPRMVQAQANKADLASIIADGDLTADVNLTSSRDNLGLALQKMVEGLNDVIGAINLAAAQITAGSAQVSDSSQSLSQGATEQAASLEEITSSMTEMASQTKNNAENASQANQLSIGAREAAETGNNQMKEMIAAMDEISSSSKEIGKIIKTIDDIAFQTNLLALNAAVEAARAGKTRQGFCRGGPGGQKPGR